MRLKGYVALFEGDAGPGGRSVDSSRNANRIKPYQQDLVLVYMQTLGLVNRAKKARSSATKCSQRTRRLTDLRCFVHAVHALEAIA